MKILVLTSSENFLNPDFENKNNFPEEIDEIRRKIISQDMVRLNKIISPEDIISIKPDLVISFGYFPIIKKEVLELLNDRAINLHLSYLPWNRGFDPIFWSIFDNTPIGVSIHYMDEGIDSGDIIARKIVEIPEDATLKSTYKILRYETEKLLYESFFPIVKGEVHRIKQTNGSMHYSKDIKKYEFLMDKGVDTPIKKIKEYSLNLK